MNSGQSRWTDLLDARMKAAGVVAWGVSPCCETSSADASDYVAWIASGCNGEMGYLERNGDLRRNPGLLLEGCRSVVSCAVPYYWGVEHSEIAIYALGDDYHDVLRRRMETVASFIRETLGGETRVCVDTAPLRERYWALRSGVGVRGLNGHVIVPESGSYCFLCEILTTTALEPTGSGRVEWCERCGACVKACPTGALRGDGTMDSRKCLSYLTIEYRGKFDPLTDLHGRLYGCDVCGAVCPHNRMPVRSTVDEFYPRSEVLEVTAETVAEMTPEEFSRRFKCSAIKRTKLTGLRRNSRRILGDD